jgi:hypothetical protein
MRPVAGTAETAPRASNLRLHLSVARSATLDGGRVTLRAVAFMDRNSEGEVSSVRLYGDTSPLFSEG